MSTTIVTPLDFQALLANVRLVMCASEVLYTLSQVTTELANHATQVTTVQLASKESALMELTLLPLEWVHVLTARPDSTVTTPMVHLNPLTAQRVTTAPQALLNPSSAQMVLTLRSTRMV